MPATKFLTNLAIIIAIMGAIALVEVIVPLFPRPSLRRGRTGANLSLMAMGFAINWMSTTAAAVLTLVQGPALMARTGLPMAAQFVVSIIVLDFFYGYLAHVALHLTPALWRVHAVHHSDPFVDVTTTYRTHPIESIWRSLFMLVPVWILGVPTPALVVYRLLSAINGLLEHANWRVWPGLDHLLSFVWVTPNMHKLHHSREHVETNSNYGNLLAIHDRLFRTFTPTRRAQSVVYGLDGTSPDAVASLPSLLSLRLRDTQLPESATRGAVQPT